MNEQATAPDPRLEEIEANVSRAESRDYPSFVIATTHAAYLLAELRKAQDKLARVEGLHRHANTPVEPWAKGHRFSGDHCTHDGQHWPCETLTAVADATGGGDS